MSQFSPGEEPIKRIDELSREVIGPVRSQSVDNIREEDHISWGFRFRGAHGHLHIPIPGHLAKFLETASRRIGMLLYAAMGGLIALIIENIERWLK